MLGYLYLDIICSLKLTIFLKLRFRKTVRFSKQIMSSDKYLSIFSSQMKAIVHYSPKTAKIHVKFVKVMQNHTLSSFKNALCEQYVE